ncbi:MAG: ferritin-like domain-containing protein [Acidimicrobiales bacterium]
MKIFPRNLTARADYVVRGNPASTRPESGVDNCYPGLEFDQRNLDKRFFPGLVVEFHRPDGAVVVDVLDGSDAAADGLRRDDLPLFLWAVLAPKPADQTVDISVSLRDRDGLEAWRHVHDLPPGRVLVLVGPGSGAQAFPFDPGIDGQLRQIRDSGQNVVQRDDDGVLRLAALVGERARYLDEDGVIDADAYAPGDLTRSLCAPWQYDFRDCGCFYWAATKPDVVTSSDGRFPFLNFQRRDRTSVPPPPDFPTNSRERRDAELDYGELIAGAWNDVLAVVVDDRENVPAVRPPEPDIELMSRPQVIEELAYLATVEHALCVEYLYAHYSLDAPMELPASGATAELVRVFAAAQELFTIAVDEMRHLRWVNEALSLLGQPPSVGRADRIGRQLDEPFTLEPLTPERLQWFIDVERPSQDLTGALDGMYVRLHTSIRRQPDVFPEHERLVHLIKLIIDEGDDHFHRFSSVQRHLAGLAPDDYLRPLADGTEPRVLALQDLSDQNYAVVIGALATTFSLDDRAGGVLIEQARRAMFNLHEVNHFMAGKGARARFTLPPTPARAPVDALAGGVAAAAAAVASSGGADERQLADRVMTRNRELFELMRRLTGEDTT